MSASPRRGPACCAPLAALVAVLLLASPALADGTSAAQPVSVDPAAHGPWVTDFRRAQAEAQRERKHLLVFFTGSDWCAWCKRLEAEVFSSADLQATIEKRFVMARLDFPRAAALQAAVPDAASNAQVRSTYDVRAYPTVLLMTAQGLPYARTGYRPGGAGAYAQHLAELCGTSGDVLRLAAAGPARATGDQITRGFAVMAEHELFSFGAYRWVLARAKALDPCGSLGLRPKVEQVEERMAFDALAQAHSSRRPAWGEIHQLLATSSHLSGGRYVQLGFQCASWLLETESKPRKAKALATKIAADPVVEKDPRARESLETLLAQCDAAIAAQTSRTARGG